MNYEKVVNEEAISHDEQLNKNKIKLISFISFIAGFAQAMIVYIMSSYFKSVSGGENVSSFYFIAYFVALILLLNLHKIVRIFGKSNVFLFTVVFKVVILSFLMISPVSFWGIIFMVLYLVFGALEWASLDVLLESFSIDNMSGRIRGKHLTFLNAGFLVGPFISMRILEKFDFSMVFICLFLINSLILLIGIIGLRKVNHKFENRVSLWELLRKVYQRKNVLRIYYISFALEFFYALMIIYTPIYLRDLGMSWNEIGIIFSIMLIPFVLVQYPMGILADRRFGEKEFIIFSILVTGISTAVVYFISSQDILLWGIILFATRVGAALLEVLRDSYFYKRIDSRDVDLINFFRTAMPSGYILASLLSFLVIWAFPLKSIFILNAGIVFSALLPAFFLVDNKCEKELKI